VKFLFLTAISIKARNSPKLTRYFQNKLQLASQQEISFRHLYKVAVVKPQHLPSREISRESSLVSLKMKLFLKNLLQKVLEKDFSNAPSLLT
jgi:hypothetical protein